MTCTGDLAVRDRKRRIGIERYSADVARGFGKKTVAEYVEGNDVLRVLKSFGVDFAQGYSVSRPVSAKDLFDLLTARKQIA
jgi:EAL domain-containing protein (putative c-di-GMP-specific phosphodiesterase class I)